MLPQACERGSPDDGFINIDDGDEVRHWARKLSTTAQQLRHAVISAGTDPDRVRMFLETLTTDADPPVRRWFDGRRR